VKTIELIVPPDRVGERIDVFITDAENIPTRSIAQKLLADGLVTCRNKILQKNYKIADGDLILCKIPLPKPCETLAEDIPLNIIFEDEHIMVINKPQGLVVHPAAGNWDGTLVNALMHHCKGKLSGIGGVMRPGIVHRLDKETSGIMVVAKNDTAHQGLAAQLANNSMVRIYNAVCVGVPKQEEIRIDAPIGRHPVNRKKMAVAAPGTKSRARHAITHIRLLERFDKHSLIQAQLETGRTHQIRVHMAHIGYPILGDTTYGSTKPPAFLKISGGQVLHAAQLAFNHPATGELVTFAAPWPEYFANVVAML